MISLLGNYLVLQVIKVSDTNTALAAKILIIAGIVYSVLEGIKKYLPQITGVYAVAVNFALTGVGFILTVPSDRLFTLPTLLGLLTAVGASAGVHGTVKKIGRA